MLHLSHASNMPLERETWWLLQETIEDGRIRAVAGIQELRAELEMREGPNAAPSPGAFRRT
jgi:hypothetical protein